MLRRLYYILLQRLFVFRNRNKPCQGKVFMFHDVSDKNDTYSISKESFNELMNHLFENNNIVSVEKMISDLSDDNVVITFDDAYASVYHNAYPLLKELDVPFYVFICNEYLNKEDYLSEDMIKEMIENSKCIIGSHNMKHELSRFMDSKKLNRDFKESKDILEEKFNVSVDCFAFPYGSIYACSDENIEDAKKYYANVFMTYSLPYNEEYKNVIPRININQSDYKEVMK